jgi:hypothetical protein
MSQNGKTEVMCCRCPALLVWRQEHLASRVCVCVCVCSGADGAALSGRGGGGRGAEGRCPGAPSAWPLPLASVNTRTHRTFCCRLRPLICGTNPGLRNSILWARLCPHLSAPYQLYKLRIWPECDDVIMRTLTWSSWAAHHVCIKCSLFVVCRTNWSGYVALDSATNASVACCNSVSGRVP